MPAFARFPAEWEPQSAVLIAWPHADTDWAERLGEVEETYIALVAAITRFQPVLDLRGRRRRADLCRSAPALRARRHGARALLSMPNTTTPGCAIPARSRCATARLPPARFPLHRLGRQVRGQPATTCWSSACIEAGTFLNSSRQNIDFALEGGAIETDGAGTLLTTWQCLHERHPEAGRDELTARLAGWLQQDRVLWLDHGYLEGDDTDAHIDTLARFAAPDAIVFQACDDPADSHYAELKAMADEIAALRTRDGQPYRLFPLPWAKPILDDGRRLAASYANFLIINGAVLMPAYGDAADARRAGRAGRSLPRPRDRAVPCRSLIWQNGSLHCITMQLPQGLVA